MRAIDLGLPSGTLWAECNIGAESPEDYGLYFSWGNIEGHVGGTYIFDESNYNSSPGHSVDANIPDYDADHGTNHDAAIANLGSPWRMPTQWEYEELGNNTDSEWTSINNVYGRKVMKKTDHSVFIFFPAAGEYIRSDSLTGGGQRAVYWASGHYDTSNARTLYVTSSSGYYGWYNERKLFGLPIRAVCKI